jgi:hypothetical protein
MSHTALVYSEKAVWDAAFAVVDLEVTSDSKHLKSQPPLEVVFHTTAT